MQTNILLFVRNVFSTYVFITVVRKERFIVSGNVQGVNVRFSSAKLLPLISFNAPGEELPKICLMFGDRKSETLVYNAALIA